MCCHQQLLKAGKNAYAAGSETKGPRSSRKGSDKLKSCEFISLSRVTSYWKSQACSASAQLHREHLERCYNPFIPSCIALVI